MDVLEEHGIEYIEMRGVNGKNVVEHTLDEIKEIKQQLDERGFKISAVGSPIGKIKITDDFAPHLRSIPSFLEIAKILEAPYSECLASFIPKGENPDNYRDNMKRWEAFIDAAKGKEH